MVDINKISNLSIIDIVNKISKTITTKSTIKF